MQKKTIKTKAGRHESSVCSRIDFPWGEVAVLWEGTGGDAPIGRIILPGRGKKAAVKDRAEAKGKKFPAHVAGYLKGDPAPLSLEGLDMGVLKGFQRRVLMATRRIPRGTVLTYGELARRLGVPRGARAVGQALAKNPFPLVIPCHRVVRSGGALGGFGGGLALKRRLLEMEGVTFDAKGKVSDSCLRKG
ncbi:MAG: MGMT family protein [Smithellaceae bacterium]|nr:MGMT family protein [Smithellaceae bacterium]